MCLWYELQSMLALSVLCVHLLCIQCVCVCVCVGGCVRGCVICGKLCVDMCMFGVSAHCAVDMCVPDMCHTFTKHIKSEQVVRIGAAAPRVF